MDINIKIKDPVSGYSHLVGAVLVFIGTIALALKADGALQMFSFLVFGISATLLYASSAWYHLFGASAEKIGLMRKLDHAFIYILIAGTFTPFCLILMGGLWGIILFAIIWTLAAIGTGAIFFQSFWKFFPRWAYTGLYLLMGWIALLLIYPLRKHHAVIGLLLLGGIFYTIGAAIYARKKPNIGKAIGFHELFHFFVLAGTLAHFYCVWRYIAMLGNKI
ncbi:MAG: hemolysin III family protein [Candidatus Nealsonbacteria bacterium DGGOD1a]|jgi:Predicted membrane protein, hemolysin III homolog|nr:MAG: hemolysin III family protein [Candidatus Nealsonbacteria bacterium DGGOD1a]